MFLLKKHNNLIHLCVVMSDDNQTESVMKATVHGACAYVLTPVKEEVIANIWQHIVRKKISKPDLTPPVQSDLTQSDGLDQHNDGSQIVDQEQNIGKKEDTAAKRTWIQSDLAQTVDLDQHNDFYKIINQDNGEQNVDKIDEKAAKKPRMLWAEDTLLVRSDLVQTDGINQAARMIWAEETLLVQSDLVQTNGLNKDNEDCIIINQDNNVQNIEKKVGKKTRKPRMTWTEDLHQKFLKAIDLVGGIESNQTFLNL